MKEIGNRNPEASLQNHGIPDCKTAFWNPSPNDLITETLHRNMGTLTQNGTLSIKTGQFTGRSPKDRFIVHDSSTAETVDWNDINQPISESHFDGLFAKVTNYMSDKDLFIKDAAACTAREHQLKLRLIAEYPWSAQFAHNMFLRLDNEELSAHEPEWVIYCAPGLHADPATDGTRESNFSIINFSKKIILIGGSGYTGEIKKGIFSVLNYLFPTEKNILPMHCSANVGEDGNTAIFFGLSGTGKTTLSADPTRQLIGDDEHGWSSDGLFNFEGGCYAKCIGLNPETEPSIYKAIKPGAILENIQFHPGTCRPNYEDTTITQNTRVSYPIHHIENIQKNEISAQPSNIFFLTCDAFGILPPISKLTTEQAMYYFISGYTAKVAGTEEGVVEPTATFSACFGAPFLPLEPNTYAELLGQKINDGNVNIWLVNTGWTAGAHGTGHRIPLKYTRSIIAAALNGDLDNVRYETLDVFDLSIPSFCPDVPSDILDPRQSWKDKEAYDKQRNHLANLFDDNFKMYEKQVGNNILAASPKVEKLQLMD